MEPMSDASSYESILLQHASNKKIPINGSLELLPLCNMDCEMCYVRLGRHEMEAKGRIRTAGEWLSLGREMQKEGVLFLLLTGGEPLLHPEFKKIYLGLRELGMIITINTNGTLIDEEWAKFFAEFPPRRINITLYGVNEDTYRRLCHYEGGYERTIHAIKLLKEYHVDVRIGCSVTSYNKDDLSCFFELAKELEVFAMADTYMVSASRERDKGFSYDSRMEAEEAASYRMINLRETFGREGYEDYLRQRLFEIENILPEEGYGCVNCYAGNCSFAVSWLGDMHPCVTMTCPSANVFELGFEAAWRHVSAQVSLIRTSKKCQRCSLRPICKNCAGNALVETGSYEGVPDYVCRYAKENYRLMKKEFERIEHEKEIQD